MYHERRVAKAIDEEEAGADDDTLARLAASGESSHLRVMEAEEENDHGSCSGEDDAADLQPTPLLHVK